MCSDTCVITWLITLFNNDLLFIFLIIEEISNYTNYIKNYVQSSIYLNALMTDTQLKSVTSSRKKHKFKKKT